ncbi:hypothetical protein L3X38_012707 [Prunus dulcis]|uniref:Uncharacterized protein n=1 Tax=Prunus dulcis TaxID=3755 RepID=A0AAD4ZGA8_PRUDU|nr:hypothetical protein L3X38_012707 [Prunus dulcis]
MGGCEIIIFIDDIAELCLHYLPSFPPTKLWCVQSLLHGIESSQTQRQVGTFIEHLVCTQGVAPQLSKGSSMESTTKFQAFQRVVRPLLSQRASASGCWLRHIGLVCLLRSCRISK